MPIIPSALLPKIQKELPTIFGYMWQCYGAPLKLVYGDNKINN